LHRYSGWRGAILLPRQRQWRSKNFHVKITARHGKSCRVDARGATARFGRTTYFGMDKSVRFENKKNNCVKFGICLKRLKIKKKSPMGQVCMHAYVRIN